jgi:epoxyqueuosine reductase QueG
MQAVVLVLLLVAGSLVHSAPQEAQEAQEGGKSMYKDTGLVNNEEAAYIAGVGWITIKRI